MQRPWGVKKFGSGAKGEARGLLQSVRGSMEGEERERRRRQKGQGLWAQRSPQDFSAGGPGRDKQGESRLATRNPAGRAQGHPRTANPRRVLTGSKRAEEAASSLALKPALFSPKRKSRSKGKSAS